MALTYNQIHKSYRAIATDRSASNWLNNGAFTSYEKDLVAVTNTCADRVGSGRRVVDAIDPELYFKSFYSYAVPEKAGRQFLGYWDVYGVEGSIAINAVDADGYVLPSFDGGNLLVVSGARSGSITLDQKLDYFQPLSDQDVTISVSGRKVSGGVKIEISLIDETQLGLFEIHSQFFGEYRRFHKSFKLPKSLKGLTFRIKLIGSGTWSVGLSGISLTLGNNPVVSYTHSIADLTIPRGTVVMTLGDSCPSGYVSIAEDRMAVVRGAPAHYIDQNMTIIEEEGQDEHDHNDTADGQIDCLEPPTDKEGSTPPILPDDGVSSIHGVPFHFVGVVTAWYPGDRPTTVLGDQHTHTLKTKMSSLPPTFKVKFCEKL